MAVRFFLLPFFLLPLLGMPHMAGAQDCAKHIRSAERNLAKVRTDAEKLKEKKKARVIAFLKDAEQLLEKAKKRCEAADGTWDKAKAAAQAVAADGHINAAHLLIKVD